MIFICQKINSIYDVYYKYKLFRCKFINLKITVYERKQNKRTGKSMMEINDNLDGSVELLSSVLSNTTWNNKHTFTRKLRAMPVSICCNIKYSVRRQNALYYTDIQLYVRYYDQLKQCQVETRFAWRFTSLVTLLHTNGVLLIKQLLQPDLSNFQNL